MNIYIWYSRKSTLQVPFRYLKSLSGDILTLEAVFSGAILTLENSSGSILTPETLSSAISAPETKQPVLRRFAPWFFLSLIITHPDHLLSVMEKFGKNYRVFPDFDRSLAKKRIFSDFQTPINTSLSPLSTTFARYSHIAEVPGSSPGVPTH